MEKYIKRPVEVETVKWTGMNHEEVLSFCGDKIAFEFSHLYIKTLEGAMHVSKGDYIIKGVEGEFYPCKPDIFHKTYQVSSEVEEGTKHDTFNLKFKEHEVFADKLVVVDEDDIPFLWIDKESKKVSFGGRYFKIYKEQQLVAEVGNLREALGFYADEENYRNISMAKLYSNIAADNGKKARQALGDSDE